MEATEELTLVIKSIDVEAGGDFAFPSRSIYMGVSPKEEAARPSANGGVQIRSGDHPRTRGRSESGDASEPADQSAEE